MLTYQPTEEQTSPQSVAAFDDGNAEGDEILSVRKGQEETAKQIGGAVFTTANRGRDARRAGSILERAAPVPSVMICDSLHGEGCVEGKEAE